MLVCDAGHTRNTTATVYTDLFRETERHRSELLEGACEQLSAYDCVKSIHGVAVDAQRTSGGFKVTLQDGSQHEGRKLSSGVVDDLSPYIRY